MGNNLSANVDNKEVGILASEVSLLLAKVFRDVEVLPRGSKKTLLSFQFHMNNVTEYINNNSVDNESILQSLIKIEDRASEFYHSCMINPTKISVLDTVSEMYNKASQLVRILKNNIKLAGKSKFISNSLLDVSLDKRIEDINVNLKVVEREAASSFNQTNEISKKVKELRTEVAELDNKFNDFILAKKAEFEQHLLYLNAKRSEVDELVGTVSGTAIYGSYYECAKNEKYWADATRIISFLLMIVVVAVIGLTLYESAGQEFNLQFVLFRFVFSIALSVPAAYTARESAKHRNQQYQYQRLSMDLKSIDPYLSSLPSDLQHKLKVEMANKMFCPAVKDGGEFDSYPINIQEIIMAIVGKINNVNADVSNTSEKNRA